MVSSARMSYPICFCMNPKCFAMYSWFFLHKKKDYYLRKRFFKEETNQYFSNFVSNLSNVLVSSHSYIICSNDCTTTFSWYSCWTGLACSLSVKGGEFCSRAEKSACRAHAWHPQKSIMNRKNKNRIWKYEGIVVAPLLALLCALERRTQRTHMTRNARY